MNALSYDRPLRVGLFGGTFNPIHCGHAQVAKDVLYRYQLASIHFIPSALPPHKTKGTLATAMDRYEMACMALAEEPSFNISDIEIKRTGPSYTIDTLRHFKALQTDDETQFFFIIGLDAFLEIHTWKSFRQLFDLAAFIVMTRPQGPNPAPDMKEQAAQFAKERISAAYALSCHGDAMVHPAKQPIYLAPVTPVDISSSRIREMIGQGQSIRNWVAPTVAAYIEKKGLYR
jgi:nicotinate-nucleotide adenylyltransferase